MIQAYGVQSITPRCNDSQLSEKKVGKKRSRTSKVRSRATGQLQAPAFRRGVVDSVKDPLETMLRKEFSRFRPR